MCTVILLPYTPPGVFGRGIVGASGCASATLTCAKGAVSPGGTPAVDRRHRGEPVCQDIRPALPVECEGRMPPSCRHPPILPTND